MSYMLDRISAEFLEYDNALVVIFKKSFFLEDIFCSIYE